MNTSISETNSMKIYNILIPVFNSVTYKSHIKDYLVINSNSKLIQEKFIINKHKYRRNKLHKNVIFQFLFLIA
jgi:hypothetical protein